MSNRTYDSPHVRPVRWILPAIAFALASALTAPSLAAQTGNVTGRVLDAGTGRPVSTAQVTIVGTSLGAIVDAQGRFRIERVPVGTREVRAIRIGYQNATATITVQAERRRERRPDDGRDRHRPRRHRGHRHRG